MARVREESSVIGFRRSFFSALVLVGTVFAADPIPWNAKVPYDTLRDSRDGRSYEAVHVGSQIWMARNLAYPMDGSWCYDRDTVLCRELGRLYTRTQAEHACPAGWRLPTGADWDTLFKAVGWAYAMDKLRSPTGWDYQRGFHPLWLLAKWIRPIAGGSSDPQLAQLGNDNFGFRVLPSGIRSAPDGIGEQALKLVKVQNATEKKEFALQGTQAYFWSATSYDETLPSSRDLYSGIAIVSRNPAFENYGFSVRCVEEGERKTDSVIRE
jgi:uncharacterized protein (TIGR02145 family)